MVKRTVDEVYEAVLGVKSDVLDVKSDVFTLKEHVNHRNESIELQISLMQSDIKKKQDSQGLAGSVAISLLKTKAGRWAAGTIATGIVATATAQRWAGPFWGILSKIAGAIAP